ncbi:O-antigen polysaccharide polymerase Wzy family protein [Paraglaciecola aquimarina]|uniref:O-antigen polysaccharide polymerase Wzy family protein n=1 Tax=Paraglaciecola algarum TaxID=3050085 RepID=A0ABS9D4J1_9ALTE|nr:O-antigen polysaccharide polymerase Wzy [Paraglaciecola sp. G1-23]MCF2947680.1 O-antigen polysaccharide polymerase Wzy family protein [Paraglaciecola sp. G1-23]
MQFTQSKTLLQKLLGIWIVSLVGVWVMAAYLNVFEAPRALLESITALNWMALSVILYITLPKGMWSICFIFMSVVGVFHIGLVLANSVGGITDEDTLYQISWWFYNVETENAIHIVNLAMISFALSAILFSKQPKDHLQHTQPNFQINLQYRKRLFHMGGILLCLFVAIFFAIILVTGAISSYGAYLEVMGNNPLYAAIFSYLYFFIGVALVFMCVSYNKEFGYFYFLVFAVWALVAFKIGLRGEVMFPSAVAACMLGRKSAPVKGYILAIGLIAFLIVTGIVKNARVSGDYSGDLGINPLNAIAEMGSSLRAVQETVKWRKNDNFELLMGGSYWAPFERQFALFIPQLERIDVNEDGRLLNIVVQKRAGPIGFSAIAEAYINFGEQGVVFVFFLFGWFMAKLDSSLSNIRNDILIGVALLPVFVTIRNSFIHVPVQIILGLCLASLLMYLGYKKQDRLNESGVQSDECS